MTAEDAYKKSMEICKIKNETTLDIIEKEIKEGINKGYTEVYFSNIIINRTQIKDFKQKGFHIRLHNNESKEDYFYKGWMEISWKPTLLDKIKKILKVKK